jgi:Mce-associated membrane protein
VTADSQDRTHPWLVWLNAAAAVVALVLAVILVIVLAGGAGGSTPDNKAGQEYDAVTRAAGAETKAFMEVDYRRMDALMARVVNGATGQFRTEYQRSGPQLKSAVVSEHSLSTGKVISVAVSTLDQDSAVVFVAADSQVTNKSTKGRAEPRYYRLQLDMAKVKSRWLVSKLQFVG